MHGGESCISFCMCLYDTAIHMLCYYQGLLIHQCKIKIYPYASYSIIQPALVYISHPYLWKFRNHERFVYILIFKWNGLLNKNIAVLQERFNNLNKELVKLEATTKRPQQATSFPTVSKKLTRVKRVHVRWPVTNTRPFKTIGLLSY